jgi:predicted extracellular nuclease
MTKQHFLIVFFFISMAASCGKVYRNKPDHFISPENAGQLIATSMKEQHNLDIVMYPSDLISPEFYILLGERSTAEDTSYVMSYMPDHNKDQFLTGTMKGEDIRKFIIKRHMDSLKKDLDVAGMRYTIEMRAGSIISSNFELDNNLIWDDEQYYRVAISNHFFFSGDTFPSYKFRNGMNFSFIPTGNIISARDSVKSFLKSEKFASFNFAYSNANYSEYTENYYAGFKKAYEIQGASHRSPLWGQKVTTRGVVTAIGNIQWFPRGIDVVIQDPRGDGRDHTSDAVNIYFPGDLLEHVVDGKTVPVKIGDMFEVTGTVFERGFTNGLSQTVIRRVTDFKVLSSNNERPRAVHVGVGGRLIPNTIMSRWIGDLNFKPNLNLDEGIDFWESLEGMRIKIRNPSVLGFRGGKEIAESETDRIRGYLSLYLLPDGDVSKEERTKAGGLTENFINKRFNPEIVHMAANHLSNGNISTRSIYNIGHNFVGDIEGVLSFESNLFGDGEFTFVIPEPQVALVGKRNLTKAANKPKTLLKGDDNKLTVATFNLKNLSGNHPLRLGQVGETISVNMNCPDILNLVEIQDDNGISFVGGNGADLTLKRLRDNMNCSGNYKWVNVDPLYNSEGGQPGGNIRVAMMYNADRVGFSAWGIPSALDTTWITDKGNLSTNPGRVDSLAIEFQNTRRSTVAQFTFKGEKIFIIGNHFNSKIGDSAIFGAHQPIAPESDRRRLPIATKINQFVRTIQARDPQANIIVAGDFNAEYNEASMVRLMGDVLVNLMFHGDLVAPNDRYTHNYNGSSTAIDFIFTNKRMLNKNPKMDVLHVNSDYMGRVTDHDPVVAQFTF